MRHSPTSFRAALMGLASIAALASFAIPADAANKVLKIGFVGVTSGPAAAWGTSNVRSMQTLADWWNSKGGVKIGDETYDIDVVTFDDQKDPKRAIAGMEKMAQEGIHYVVGPNVDDGAAAVRPVAEKSGIIYFPYAFPKELYTKPASNAVLGMVANYQSGPAIYKYLKENKGVKTIAFVAANESDPLSQRDGGVAAAKALGLDVVADKDTYQNDTRDFTPVLTPIVKLKPDLLVLSGVAPANAPLLIRSARELGYQGAHLDRDGAGRQGARGRRGRPRQRLHLGRRRLDAGNPLQGDGRVHRPLHQEVRRVQRRVEHQGLRARIYHRHAEGRSEGDRQRRRIQEDDRFLLRAEPLSQGLVGDARTTSARRRSARSVSSPCRWSSTNTRTASSRPCSSPTSTDRSASARLVRAP